VKRCEGEETQLLLSLPYNVFKMQHPVKRLKIRTLNRINYFYKIRILPRQAEDTRGSNSQTVRGCLSGGYAGARRFEWQRPRSLSSLCKRLKHETHRMMLQHSFPSSFRFLLFPCRYSLSLHFCCATCSQQVQSYLLCVAMRWRFSFHVPSLFAKA
jgi:hypothetical protein